MRQFIMVIVCILIIGNLYPQEPALVLPIGHTNVITTVKFNPDADKIVTASADKTAKVWEAATGKLIFTLKGHESKVDRAEFTHDGKKIITASFSDSTINIWNAATGQLLVTLRYISRFYLMECSNDDEKIATVSRNKIQIWDARTANLLKTLVCPDYSISAIAFNKESKEIAAAAYSGTIFVWDLATEKITKTLTGHAIVPRAVRYSPDGKKIITESGWSILDGTVRIWDAKTGKLLKIFGGKEDRLTNAKINSNGMLMVAVSFKIVKIFDLVTAKLIRSYTDWDGISDVDFSKDGKKILGKGNYAPFTWDFANEKSIKAIKADISDKGSCFNAEGTKLVVGDRFNFGPLMYNAENGKLLMQPTDITSHENTLEVSADGSLLLTNEFNQLKIKDARTGRFLFFFQPGTPLAARFSPDGKKVITADWNNIQVWDIESRKLQFHFNPFDREGPAYNAFYNVSSTRIVTFGPAEERTKIWNATDGKLMHTLQQGGTAEYVEFSADDKKILTCSDDSKVRVWNVDSGDVQHVFENTGLGTQAHFSADGKKIITTYPDGKTCRIWDAEKGTVLFELNTGNVDRKNNLNFSLDGKKLVTVTSDGFAKVWDAENGQLLLDSVGSSYYIVTAVFSPDNQLLLTYAQDGKYSIWNSDNGQFVNTLTGHGGAINFVHFTNDNQYIITGANDRTNKYWDGHTGELLFTQVLLKGNEYLNVDKDGRFDGSSAARKALYFTCEDEVIELEQFENLCWEPGLVAKKMGFSKDSITAAKIADVTICNTSPVVKKKGSSNGIYQFSIIPRDGGIGEVQLYVNDKLVKQYPLSVLTKTKEGYDLSVNQQELRSYFLKGVENEVLVKATTAEGSITSRGVRQAKSTGGEQNRIPNMYIVSVGVSKYKGEGIQLQYASTDAERFAAALTASAKKLLNVTDKKEHINTYIFSTTTNSNNWPAKQAIQKKLEEIAQVAAPEDIFIFFFAGHGVIQSSQKKFYLLTAEATGFDMAGVEKKVAISTDELNVWMQHIKANKQVLILDACNSGQAVSDLQAQFAKRDVPADQVRALEDLKDKNGTFILAASASGQSAYESSQFGQGLLTYSLLSGIKNQDGLKENKYIDVTGWFNNASNKVRVLTKEMKGRQEPQIIGNASFDVGLVDAEVMNGIKLPDPKKIIARSFLYSGDTKLLIDELSLANDIDRELNNASANDAKSPIVYIGNNTSAEAYFVRGSYETKAGNITVKLSLIQKNKLVKEFAGTGLVNKKEELAKKIAEDVTGFLKSN